MCEGTDRNDKQLLGSSSEQFNYKQEAELLKAEWRGVLDVFISQCTQYSTKLTIFGTIIITTLTIATGNPKFEFVHVLIPVLMLLVGYATVAQAYFIIVLVGGMGLIERRITELNGGKPIMQTEHRIWATLMLPPVIRYKMKEKSTRTLPMVNPLFVAMIFGVIGVTVVNVFCAVKSYGILPRGWNMAYCLFILFATIGLSIQSTLFFRFEQKMQMITFGAEA